MFLIFRKLNHAKDESITFGLFSTEEKAQNEVTQFLKEFCEFGLSHFQVIRLSKGEPTIQGIPIDVRLPGNGSLGL